ncbi:MAG TPA: indole-3-glycerol phosphate synthase TrpC [Ohtaekwangia sp.]|nr:indole-3-glycerol phosphate synthase TrpC [Ohtaekwangia sp.]
MNILDKIIAYKRKEVEEQKHLCSVKSLEQSGHFNTQPLSMRRFIQREDLTGIIAEFKRKSPSKGIINADAPVTQTTMGYVQAGVSALSVLTDTPSFGGSNDDLMAARKVNSCPIIRKDFTVDEYQIVEAKSIGADAILLIAAVLSPQQTKQFCKVAHTLGLEVLLEVHDEAELQQHLDAGADLIGVNNRNLKTFDVSIDVSKRLASLIPDHVVKVSESGISNTGTILELRQYGYQGFLMGENFMKQSRPDKSAQEFIQELRKAELQNK